MRILGVLGVWCVLLAATARARAEEPAAPASPPLSAESQLSVALGSNLPLLWKDGGSVAASMYLGVSDHHAIRANLASYKNHNYNILGEISYTGRITDVGIGWVYYPRRVWSGFMVEAGALRRARDTGTYDSFASPEFVNTKTTVYAARALVGWSWLMYRHLFVAVAAGISVGRESGIEISHPDGSNVMTRSSVARLDTTGEAYLRVGFAFDI